ncbi:MAG: ribosome maturation factor RimM [Candidatus Dormibacteraeota bacterium]|nr:ribosome maturation factor RimM [Candidatus Dormibacteraeota bacterium]
MTTGAQPDLRIGRVLKAHGVRGVVRVESLTDFPDRFAKGRQLTIAGRRLTITRSNESAGGLLLMFAEIQNREDAAALRGAYITVPLSEARPLPPSRFYHYQLVGLLVVDRGSGRSLGSVAEVLTYPANDVLRVTDGPRERLIPMVSSVVVAVELAKGRVMVDLPEEVDA